mmetsp:Transcript_64456/g.106713  ORF Transcript_64456/g.106713 Transcript_64456/m.106713 type:complete len:257 (-) Transcript_64456:8894-9664(-)
MPRLIRVAAQLVLSHVRAVMASVVSCRSLRVASVVYPLVASSWNLGRGRTWNLSTSTLQLLTMVMRTHALLTSFRSAKMTSLMVFLSGQLPVPMKPMVMVWLLVQFSPRGACPFGPGPLDPGPLPGTNPKFGLVNTGLSTQVFAPEADGLQTCVGSQAGLQTGMVQSAPSKVLGHVHTPAPMAAFHTQSPPQPGQMGVSQPVPSQPLAHSQLPRLHTPWPLQSVGSHFTRAARAARSVGFMGCVSCSSSSLSASWS